MVRSTSAWRLNSIVSEGYRNFRFGRWTTAVLVMLAGLALGVPAAVDIIAVTRMVNAEQDWLEAGGTVIIATNAGAGGVVSQGCDELGRLPGVAGAAALSRWPDAVSLTIAPDAPVTLVGATSGVADLLALEAATPGLIVPTSLAERTSLRPSGVAVLRPLATGPNTPEREPGPVAPRDPPPATPLKITAVSNLEMLGEVMGSGIIVPMTSTGLADACYVRALPGYRDALADALPAKVTPAGAPEATIVSDRLIEGEFSRDYAAEYDSRGLKHVPFSAGAAIGLLWLLIRWMRRDSDGLYATLGADRTTRSSIRLCEWTLLLCAVSALGIAGALAVSLWRDIPLSIAVPHLIRATLTFTLASSAVAAMWAFAPMRSPLTALKDR